MHTQPGLTIGHTVVAGDVTQGGTCNLITLREDGEVRAKFALDIGRIVVARPEPGRSIHQTSDIACDLDGADGIVISHGHDDHISGLPALVKEMRRLGLEVPPIHLERTSHEIARHEFALQKEPMDGLRFEYIEPAKPFFLGEADRKLKITPYALSHTMPTLGFIIQTDEKDPVTMVWESDVKDDPTVTLRPGHSIAEVKQMAGGGPIHNLAADLYTFNFSGRNTRDGDITEKLAEGVKGYDHVVFVTYGGNPDRAVMSAQVAAQAGKDALVYNGKTHGIYLGALEAGGFDLARVASPDRPFRIVPLEDTTIGADGAFHLTDTDYVDVRGILEGRDGSPHVPLGPKTVFAYVGAMPDAEVRQAIAASGSHLMQTGLISAHGHRLNELERIAEYDALSVTPLHAAKEQQEQFVRRQQELEGRDYSCALPGQEYIIGHEGRELSPVQRVFARLDMPGCALLTSARPPHLPIVVPQVTTAAIPATMTA